MLGLHCVYIFLYSQSCSGFLYELVIKGAFKIIKCDFFSVSKWW